MIEFENPAAFFLLLLIPALYFLRAAHIFTRMTFPLVLADWNGSQFEWKNGLRSFFSGFVQVLMICSFVCTIIACAEPVVHHQEKVYSSRGADILFVIDTSPSMAARDIAGTSRIEAAKQAIAVLAQQNSGATVGLVQMAKDAALVVPPTMERSAFFTRLESLIAGELGDGTAIGTGISYAVYHLESSQSPKKSIVLITDGENNAGAIHPLTAAHLAKEKNISLYVLGIGTRGRVSIEYVDPKTGRVYSGDFDSNYDIHKLAQIATEANGKFFTIENMSDLSQALESVSKNESVAQSYHLKNHDAQYYRQFLYLAGLLAILAWIIRSLVLREVL
ncbi:MAG: VWA domain-containing protein [Treponema sp.]|nr:VWA domain-containing protein [Treponema sp.]